jgi:hypothetical protein
MDSLPPNDPNKTNASPTLVTRQTTAQSSSVTDSSSAAAANVATAHGTGCSSSGYVYEKGVQDVSDAPAAEEPSPSSKRGRMQVFGNLDKDVVPPPGKRFKENTAALQVLESLLLENEKENSCGERKEDEEEMAGRRSQKIAALLGQQVDSLLQFGVDACHSLERVQDDYNRLEDASKIKDVELRRLRQAEEQAQATIKVSPSRELTNYFAQSFFSRLLTYLHFLPCLYQNLMQTVETSRTNARQLARSFVTEASIRADLVKETELKNEALASAAEYQRKAARLDEDVHQLKAKCTRVSQEKLKLERDQRAAASLARSLDQHAATDVDYYKRKVTELNGQVQSVHALLIDKSRQMDEMRRQLERSLSRQALSAARRDESCAKRAP